MKIILTRHGDAGAYTLPDHERNLSDLGKAQATQTAHWLADYAKKNGSPTLFISSPYNRAYQTCEIVKQGFPTVPHTVFEHITPDDDAKIAIDGLYPLVEDLAEDSCVVIVCHMNIIAYMASILTGDTPESFGLAEARVFKAEVFAPNLAVEIERFSPVNH
ncbi:MULTISPECIES: SixA phosphatase family protein [unclassified Moraxella]|uniref:SixA phosphatase family protein n=1 Tax=unclassified Moraxella TaxID=2685852 RepID=UPI003AF78D98